MVDIRAASYSSSYTSGTLTVAIPSGMHIGDSLTVFLLAISKYWGHVYSGTGWHAELGNPPPGNPVPPGGSGAPWPPGGPTLSEYPHDPPISVLANQANLFYHPWTDTAGDHGYYGNWWSTLGYLDWTTGVDNAPSHAALAQWPFISSWWAPDSAASSTEFGCGGMTSVTTIGRTVDGSEASSYAFTLNNPLDADYDYRGFAVCLTPNDWGGNYYDPPDDGGSGAASFRTRDDAYYIATGARSSQDIGIGSNAGSPFHEINISTRRIAATTALVPFQQLDAYIPSSWWGSWPLSPTYDYPYLADPSSPELGEATRPQDYPLTDDLVLNLICYSGPSSFGDPTGVTVADLSSTPHVDPLPVLHREIWTKGTNTLMVHLSWARPSASHPTDAGGVGLMTLHQRILSDAGGPIAATYPPGIAADTTENTEHGLGLALTFRVRVPYAVAPMVAIPARLATIVG